MVRLRAGLSTTAPGRHLAVCEPWPGLSFDAAAHRAGRSAARGVFLRRKHDHLAGLGVGWGWGWG